MIAAFADEGITTYDLNPSGGRAGVARFKESLGGIPAQTQVVVRRSALERTVDVARRARTVRLRNGVPKTSPLQPEASQ